MSYPNRVEVMLRGRSLVPGLRVSLRSARTLPGGRASSYSVLNSFLAGAE
jgi:hypothetical protein